MTYTVLFKIEELISKVLSLNGLQNLNICISNNHGNNLLTIDYNSNSINKGTFIVIELYNYTITKLNINMKIKNNMFADTCIQNVES